MKLTERINFRQPKYMLPAIVYLPLLGASYFIFDLFDTKVAEKKDANMQTTEYLNPNLPQAHIKGGDGIGGKYENMLNAYGKIEDHSAVENIDRDNEQEKEEYQSKYSDAELQQLDAEAKRQAELEKTREAQEAHERQRENEALTELNKALAEARLKGQQATQANISTSAATSPADSQDSAKGGINIEGKIKVNENARKEADENDKPSEVVKKVKTSSDYFNTLAVNEKEPTLIKAIIDENIKAMDGSRVRLRLLDDVEIGEMVVKKGAYLYATMSGFSSQRVKGTVKSVLVDDEIVKINLSLYDTDGMEGLYVPSSQFRETTKDVASGAVTGNVDMNMNTTNTGSSFSQWGMQTMQNAYQKTSNAIGKAIKKNKVKLKYGTFVYLINSKETKSK